MPVPVNIFAVRKTQNINPNAMKMDKFKIKKAGHVAGSTLINLQNKTKISVFQTLLSFKGTGACMHRRRLRQRQVFTSFRYQRYWSKGKHYTGAISFRGRPLDETARHQIGLVLQNPHSQMISTLVREELMFACTEKNNDETKVRFKRTVEILGLAPLLINPSAPFHRGKNILSP